MDTLWKWTWNINYARCLFWNITWEPASSQGSCCDQQANYWSWLEYQGLFHAPWDVSQIYVTILRKIFGDVVEGGAYLWIFKGGKGHKHFYKKSGSTWVPCPRRHALFLRKLWGCTGVPSNWGIYTPLARQFEDCNFRHTKLHIFTFLPHCN